MFGQNAITSSWANPQQNQQQQQGTSAFGQPSTFGSTGFGSTSNSVFGQPQQQQPQANPMFGNLGGTTSNTGGGGFGAFGGGTNQASTSTNPLFGGAKPATGFGAFGGGGTFGNTGTSTFGQPSAGGTAGFGQPSNTSTGGAFGNTGSSIFGQNKGTSAFGTTTTTNASNPVTTGSSNPPYQVFTEKDPNSPNTTLQYHSISCMPAYAGTSFEELRLQDYQQGRKTAATSSFGQPSTFGGTQTGGSIFGQPQNQQNNSIFGANKPATGFGSFGATNTTNTGATNTFGGGGTFGQPQQQSTGFGAFGQPQQQQQQQQQGSSIFGGNTGGGAFGSTGNTGNTFGSTTGAFGQNNNQQQQQQQQQQQTGSIFGQQQPAASTTTGFGSFGNTANKPSIFNQPSQPAGQTGSLFGGGSNIFGQPQNQQQGQQQQQQQQQPSIFGNTTGNSLFGNNQQQNTQQQPAAGTSLFGNTQNTGTTTGNSLFGGSSLFGQNNQQQQQQQQAQQPATTGFGGGGLFGNANKPAGTGGLFGSSTFGTTQPAANTQQPGLFSSTLNQPNNQQQSTLGGGLFGNKAPTLGQSTSTGAGGGGLFGSTFGGSTNTMNASTAVPGAQGTLTASISQPISTNLPIFSMLPPGPRAVDLEQSTKKKPGFFVDIPTRSPVPRMQLGYTPANSKLRGFGSSTSSNALGASMFSSSSNALSLSRTQPSKNPIEAIFGTSSSPSLGSGQRKSVKKLILDKKVEPTELFIKSGGSPLRGGGKITFSPALSVAAREKEAAAAAAITASSTPAQPAKSPTPTPQPHRTPKKFTASANSGQPDDDGDLQEGDYYVKPDLDTLKSAGFDQLSSFKNLVVGRVGYGEIHFLEPVDLTGLLKLGALLGEVIRFDDKECSVYPDSDDADKPPPGAGLNVRAKISLKRCWAIDKAHREPIKDEKHPSAVKHLKKLKNMKDTHFESFDISDGTWTFTVDHF